MLRGIIFFWLLLVATSASAFSLSDYNGRCGDVDIYMGPTDGRHGYSAAHSYDNVHSGYIVLDPEFIKSHSDLAIEFLYFHECGHRVFGHTSAYIGRGEENLADCYAARRFARLHGRHKLKRVANEMLPINGEPRSKRILHCR